MKSTDFPRRQQWLDWRNLPDDRYVHTPALPESDRVKGLVQSGRNCAVFVIARYWVMCQPLI
jgi:hypothetical protein